jgi:hypothetical protein
MVVGLVVGLNMRWTIEQPDPAYSTPMEYMEAHMLDELHVLVTRGYKREPYVGTLRWMDGRVWSPDFLALDRQNWAGWQALWPAE